VLRGVERAQSDGMYMRKERGPRAVLRYRQRVREVGTRRVSPSRRRVTANRRQLSGAAIQRPVVTYEAQHGMGSEGFMSEAAPRRFLARTSIYACHAGKTGGANPAWRRLPHAHMA